MQRLDYKESKKQCLKLIEILCLAWQYLFITQVETINAHGVSTLEGSIFTNIQVEVQQEGKQGTHWQFGE